MFNWLRTALALLLCIAVFFALAATLLALRVNSTLLNADFYLAQLREAEAYEFLLVDLTTSALDEVRRLETDELPGRLESNPLVSLDLSTDEIVGALSRAVPPDWLQAQVEDSIGPFIRYMSGERDHFEITLRPGERAAVLMSEMEALLLQARVYDVLFEEAVEPAIQSALANRSLPLGMDLSQEQLVSSVRAVLAPDWVHAQLRQALDEVTAYMVGQQDSFRVHVELSDRLDVALTELKKLLRQANAYDALYAEVVEPSVAANLGEGVALPLGIVVTPEEVASTLRQVAPPDWVQEQAERLMDEAAPYLAGETESFTFQVSIRENKLRAVGVLESRVEEEVRAAIRRLPRCDGATSRDLSINSLEDLPDCVPSDIDLDQWLASWSFSVPQEVQDIILSALPDTISFTDADLRRAMVEAGAQEELKRLDDLRALMRDGWTYTDADLRQDLLERAGQGAVARLDTAREILSNGWRYSDADFMADLQEHGDPSAVQAIDSLRSKARLARTLRWALLLVTLALVAAVAFVGGRTWRGRVAWAAAALTVPALAIYVAVRVTYSVVVGPRIQALRDQLLVRPVSNDGPFQDTSILVATRAADMLKSVVDSFVLGIAGYSLALLVIGLAVLLACMAWPRLRKLVLRLRAARGTSSLASPS